MMRSLLTTFLLLAAATCISSAADGYLGISVRPLSDNSEAGLRIVHVFDDGAAAVSGLRTNDIVAAVNGQPVNSMMEFRHMLAPYSWGDAVLLGIVRDGKPVSLKVNLGHAATSKTHQILKSEQLSGETIWYFDDNTTVVMQGDRPVSVTNKVDGVKQTLVLQGLAGFNELPQRFMDLPEKLDVIAYTLEEQRLRGEDADRITFILETVGEQEKAPAGIAQAGAEVFEVYPNPSSGKFQVRVEAPYTGEFSWNVYDLRGASLVSGRQPGFNGVFDGQIDITGAQKGLYLLYISLGEDKLTRQIVLE